MGGGALPFAAEGHQHAACADGGVKALGESTLRGGLQAGRHFAEAPPVGRVDEPSLNGRDFRICVLRCAVGVQEIPTQIYDGLAPPAHHHPGRIRDDGDGISLQIL